MDALNGWQEYGGELGRKIKAYRIEKGLSQQELEDRSGVSVRSISRLEQGASVQTDNLFKILIALNLGENIELLVPDQTARPSYYLEKRDDRPMRVKKKTAVKKDFKWGDEA